MALRLALLTLTAILAGCGGDSGSSSKLAAPGTLTMYGASGFPVQNTSFAFIAAQGSSTPNTQYVSVFPSSEAYLAASQTGEMFSYTLTGSSVTITPAAPVEVGSYTGTIMVSGCYIPSGWPCDHVSNSPKSINISYTVHGLSVTPAQLSFSSAGGNPAAQTATLAVTGGSSSYTWQVSYSPSVAPWLQITPSGGAADLSNGPQTVTFNVNAAGLAAGVYSAVATFSTPSSFSAPLAVTLSVGDPSVNFIAPYVVPAGAAGTVIIRGRGFAALSGGSLSVQFNSTSAPSASVVSDTEIRATYPALAAGSYSVSVSSGGPPMPRRAALKLVVVDPPGFPLTTIPRPASAGVPQDLIYDAEREALLFVDSSNGRVLRYALSGSGDASADFSFVGRIGLSPDGTELIRATYGQLSRLDPVTLAVVSSESVGAGLMPASFANDGGAIALGNSSIGAWLYRYDLLTKAVTPVSFQPHMNSRAIFASADGSMLVLPYSSSGPSDTRVYTYDAGTGRLSPRPGTTAAVRRPSSVSRDGSRIVLANISRVQTTSFAQVANASATQTTVYDGQFNVVGSLPREVDAVVLSPDGSFAYGYSSADGRLRKFNVGAPGASEIGSGSVVAPANTAMSEMTISPDGGTVFLAGRTSVVIAPAP